jgi:hypothetical protein
VGLNQVSVPSAFNIEATQASLLAILAKGAYGCDAYGTEESRTVTTTIPTKGVESDFPFPLLREIRKHPRCQVPRGYEMAVMVCI